MKFTGIDLELSTRHWCDGHGSSKTKQTYVIHTSMMRNCLVLCYDCIIELGEQAGKLQAKVIVNAVKQEDTRNDS